MDRFVGKRLDGRYEIQEIIGVGGMAVVYKAHDNQENRTVAVKILKEEFVSNEEFLRRFKNESKAIAMLSHPNIVNVYDVSFGDLIQYIVMEYIEGITLKEFIEQEGSLRWKDALHFTTQILKGLQHAHDKGIVHRDVKPQNIMVLPDGTIKVTDFGIARFARSEQRTITDKAIGSVHYISPEQARGENTNEKADIYSVGVMLYEMLTGKLPFQAENAVSVAIMQLQRDPQLPTELNGSIPLGLEQITMHAMQKTTERRYQSAAEMLCDLVQFRKDPALTFEYTYFVDNSPTKFASDLGIAEETAEPETNEEEEVREKTSVVPILAGIAVTFVIAIVALAVIFVPKLFSNTGEEFDCPNFVGQNIEDINSNPEYKEKDLKFDIKWDISEEYEKNIVFEQSETAGENLKKGATITLYVSTGGSTIRVPEELYDMTEAAAKPLLESLGFEVAVELEPSQDVPEGSVIRSEPQRTEVVKPGQKITLYVSSGKPTKNVLIPDVVGFSKDAAEEKLKAEDLAVITEEVQITMDDKYYPIGYVVKQEPEKSSKEVPEGTEVKIYVCSGYKYDVVLDDLPKDYKTQSYHLTLWENGTMIDKGDKIDSKTVKSYTFDGLVATGTKLNLVVKISSDGTNEENLYDITVDNENGRVKITKKYEYTEYQEPEETDSNVPSEPTTSTEEESVVDTGADESSVTAQ